MIGESGYAESANRATPASDIRVWELSDRRAAITSGPAGSAMASTYDRRLSGLTGGLHGPTRVRVSVYTQLGRLDHAPISS